MQNPPPPPGYPPPPPPQMPSGYQPMAVASPGSYGGFWIRVVAYIIDAILLSIVAAILSIPFGVNYSDPNSLSSGAARASNGIELLLSFVYFTVLWTYMGASLGQRLLGLHVVDATTGQSIGFGKAAVRWIGVVISFFVCFIGVIWVAFDARKQGWGDKIAGTVVVRR